MEKCAICDESLDRCTCCLGEGMYASWIWGTRIALCVSRGLDRPIPEK